MQTASSAKRTCSESRSASESTATVSIPSSRAARRIRRAISPRLATRLFLNIPLDEIRFLLERLPGFVRSAVDPLHAELELGRVGAVPEPGLEADLPLGMHLHDRLVEGLDAV